MAAHRKPAPPTERRIALSPSASSVITLVAENPDMSEARIAQLISYIEEAQRAIVAQIVSVIREKRSKAGKQRRKARTDASPEVIKIADAYSQWVHENATTPDGKPAERCSFA